MTLPVLDASLSGRDSGLDKTHPLLTELEALRHTLRQHQVRSLPILLLSARLCRVSHP
jgi:hypothetical protein